MMFSLTKPGTDHSIPKGYRPIALLNTIGKVTEFILARRIAYMILGGDTWTASG